MQDQRPTEIAVAVVRRHDAVLAGPRPRGAPLAGFWEFPGGKIDPGESPGEAAVRECREETGIAIRLVRPLAVVEHRYGHGSVRLHFFDASPTEVGSSPRAPFRWIQVAQLRASEFLPANAVIIEVLKGPS
ncbi:MAG: (deoxy)nucleoside triphosphate pyrophosphohydrolase [Thermoguttaceae bacterium]